MKRIEDVAFHHLGLTVPDLDIAEEFFVNLFECEVIYREGFYGDADGNMMADCFDTHPRSTVRDVMLRLPSGELLELLEYTVPDGTRSRPAPANSDNSAPHIAFAVSDVDASIARLADYPGVVVKTASTIEEGPAAGMRWAYLKTPWGLTIEIVKP